MRAAVLRAFGQAPRWKEFPPCPGPARIRDRRAAVPAPARLDLSLALVPRPGVRDHGTGLR
jgi:hypothetical protein